ncbi:hypothetical protein JCM11251_005960 [Rhodosporidiobolus azoricus]
MLRLPLSTTARKASTRALPLRLSPHTSSPPFAAPLVETASALPQGAAIVLPDMSAVEKATQAIVAVPLLPDAYSTTSASASHFNFRPLEVQTVSHPSTHLSGGPSSTGAASNYSFFFLLFR